jgi:hypothetical protein
MSASNFCLAIAAESLMYKDQQNMLDYQLSETPLKYVIFTYVYLHSVLVFFLSRLRH